MNQTGSKSHIPADRKTQASRLFLDGYRAERLDEETVVMRDPQGNQYLVSTLFQECTCESAERGSCVHLLGWEKLLADQQGYDEALVAAMEAEHDPWNLTLENDRTERLLREIGVFDF